MLNTQTVEAGERTQFAPGPWRVDAETPNHGPIITTTEDGPGGRDLATIFGDSKEERAATARLIAAAPDMLATLKLILYMTASTDTIHQMARKSIVEAGGEIA